MNIGQAAKASGIPAKMIRYYERIGLVAPARRLKNGYRDYDAADVHRLRFVRSARQLGFPLTRVSEMLSLWSDRKRRRAQVKALALAQIAELEARANELTQMIEILRGLSRNPERSLSR